MKKTIIISLGGSIIVPDKIDVNYLIKFKKFILKYLKKYNFVIFCGGGRIARNYQEAGKKIANLSSAQLDWLGISASILNANLLKSIFVNNSQTEIITIPTKKVKFFKPIIIGAGWQPGWSTDYDAIKLAQVNNVKTVINLSNIDCVYNKDPRKYKNAKKIDLISWKDFIQMIGTKWSPGLNTPFDPIAAKLAKQAKIKVAIMSGIDLNNLEKFLNHKKFKGTLVI